MSSSELHRVNTLIYQNVKYPGHILCLPKFWNIEPCLCFQQFNHVVDESYRTIDEVKGNLDGESGEEWHLVWVLLTAVLVRRLTSACFSPVKIRRWTSVGNTDPDATERKSGLGTDLTQSSG